MKTANNINECKREYLDLLYKEIRSRGYTNDEAQYVIDRSDFITLLDSHTESVTHVSVSQMADDLLRKIVCARSCS